MGVTKQAVSARRLGKVIGVTPAMLDVTFRAPGPSKRYFDALSSVGAKPGDWTAVDSSRDFDDLVIRLTGERLDAFVSHNPDFVQLGSTVVGSLKAFKSSVRPVRSARFIIGASSVTGFPETQRVLRRRIGACRIPYTVFRASGTFDICLATYHNEAPERTMFVLHGIGPGVHHHLFGGVSRSTFLLSAFELHRELVAIDEARLRNQQSHVALSLGDRKILLGPLSRRVRGLINSGVVSHLFGDLGEYAALLTDRGAQVGTNSVVERLQAFSRRSPATFLATAGAVGMYGIRGGHSVFLPARQVIGLVNTNGAGDAAAGGFLSSLLNGQGVERALLVARERAEEVLVSPHGAIGL